MHTLNAYLDPDTHRIVDNEAIRLNAEIDRDYTPEQWTALTWAASFIPALRGESDSEAHAPDMPDIDLSGPFVPTIPEPDNTPISCPLNADTITHQCNGEQMFVRTRYGLAVVVYIPGNEEQPSGYAAILADITSPYRQCEASHARLRNAAIRGVYYAIAANQMTADNMGQADEAQISHNQAMRIIVHAAARHVEHRLLEHKQISVVTYPSWDSLVQQIELRVRWPREMYPDAPRVGGLFAALCSMELAQRETVYRCAVEIYDNGGRLVIRPDTESVSFESIYIDGNDSPAPNDIYYDDLAILFFWDGVDLLTQPAGSHERGY